MNKTSDQILFLDKFNERKSLIRKQDLFSMNNTLQGTDANKNIRQSKKTEEMV